MTQNQQLSDNGYFVVEEFLTPDEVQRLRAATRRFPEQLKGRASSEYLVRWDGPENIQQILHAEKLSPTLDRINRAERTIQFLRQFYGYDVGLYHSKFVLKDAGGHEVPWHQDFTYWAAQSEHPCQLNCMVYLDDADEENGCLLVVPGSHRQGLQQHRYTPDHGAFCAELDAVDPATVRALPGKAGMAIFFGPFLVHASRRNLTTRPRHTFTTVYTNPLIDVHRDVYSRFFPVEHIKAMKGSGPFRFCGENYQRRNLWQLAADHVASKTWNWIEITDRTYNDGSFEWLSAHKAPRSVYFRYEQFPVNASNRDDVLVRAGLLSDTLKNIQGPCGLLFLDCDRIVTAKTALRALTESLREGTVVVFDNFYNYHGWEFGTYKAFQDFVIERKLGFDYLGRSHQQVAIRLTAGPPCGCPSILWNPVSEGIEYA